MGFTPTRVPSKPGSGPPAQSRVWRPCRWYRVTLCTEEQPVPAQSGQQRALPCHADCSCLSLQDRQLTSRRPPALTAAGSRCAIQHPSPFQRRCLIPWTGSLGLHSGQLPDSLGDPGHHNRVTPQPHHQFHSHSMPGPLRPLMSLNLKERRYRPSSCGETDTGEAK